MGSSIQMLIICTQMCSNFEPPVVCFILFYLCIVQGKVFPKLKKRLPPGSGSSDSVSDKEEDEAMDYVFRIIFPNSQSEFGGFFDAEKHVDMSFAQRPRDCSMLMKMLLLVCYSDCNSPSPSDFFSLPSTEWTAPVQNRDPGCTQEVLELSQRIPLTRRKQL